MPKKQRRTVEPVLVKVDDETSTEIKQHTRKREQIAVTGWAEGGPVQGTKNGKKRKVKDKQETRKRQKEGTNREKEEEAKPQKEEEEYVSESNMLLTEETEEDIFQFSQTSPVLSNAALMIETCKERPECTESTNQQSEPKQGGGQDNSSPKTPERASIEYQYYKRAMPPPIKLQRKEAIKRHKKTTQYPANLKGAELFPATLPANGTTSTPLLRHKQRSLKQRSLSIAKGQTEE